jgi:lysophospholipase L1-like esterase
MNRRKLLKGALMAAAALALKPATVQGQDNDMRTLAQGFNRINLPLVMGGGGGAAYRYLYRAAGPVAPNTDFTASPNCLIGFRVAVIGDVFRLRVRKQDDTHYWMFEVGGSGEYFTLYEANGGAPGYVDAVQYVATSEANILVYLYGSTMQWYLNGRLIYSKTDAADFATATTVRFSDYVGGCDLQDLFILQLDAPIQPAQIAQLSGYPGLVIFDGDSRLASPVPWRTMSKAAIAPAKRGWKVAAVGGQGFAQILARIPTVIAPETIYRQPPVVVFLAGVNNAGNTPAENYASVVEYCSQVRALGYKIVLCTDIDAQDAPRNTYNWHTLYPEYNNLIRAGAAGICDALVDLGADVRFQNALDTTYYNADKVHQTAAGHQAMADLIAPVLAGLLG